MKLSLQSNLTLYPLTIRPDKKHFIVEESLTGEFYEMPKICIDAIDFINKGETLGEIELKLQPKYPEEEVDLLAFGQQLLELGLTKEIDGVAVQITKQNQSPEGFIWLSPRVGRFVFNKITTKLFATIICINILLLIMNPQLLPNYQDLFLFDAMMFNVLTYMGVSLLLILIHEFGHILAVRSHNLPAKLEVGHRLFLVVFETDLSPAWKLSPRQRNSLYLGGICLDQLVIFITFAISLIFLEGNSFITGILALIILDIFIKTIYQCCFYMKTDLYYLFENLTGCYNLMENSKQYLSKWFPFIKKDSTTQTFEDEEKFVRLYGIFYICGVLLTFGLLLFYFIPQALYAYSETLPELMNPIGNPYFWDALIFLGQTMVMIGLLIYSWNKSKRSRTY
ncbi:peptidase [Virgibacillus sp. DJP39]|uniref:peptidase n=1 Tax=Virgibacillus sp. DJP39 TaxID=3409790 RepID=UPI003BB578D9